VEVRVAPVVVGADRDHEGVVGRLGHRRRAGAAVAGGHHHDDALVPEALDGEVEGVELGALGRGGAPRQVEDPDVELGPVAGHPVHGPEDAGHVGDAVGAGRLHGDHLGGRGHPDVGPLPVGRRVGTVAGDEPRHHGAVAVGVRRRVLAGEVGSVDDPRREVVDR
jgi:hypothetical protein